MSSSADVTPLPSKTGLVWPLPVEHVNMFALLTPLLLRAYVVPQVLEVFGAIMMAQAVVWTLCTTYRGLMGHSVIYFSENAVGIIFCFGFAYSWTFYTGAYGAAQPTDMIPTLVSSVVVYTLGYHFMESALDFWNVFCARGVAKAMKKD